MRNQSKSPIKLRQSNGNNRSQIATPDRTLQKKGQGLLQQNQVDETELKDKVSIIIRIRPTLTNELQEQFIRQVDDSTLKIMRPGNSLHMKFNSILPSASNQDDVYNLTQESILSFLNGTNNTIFAYGQTGAGKTYTILGDHSENPSQLNNEKILSYLQGQERGILPRSLYQILSELSKRDQEDYRLYISFFEVYNEKIYDLFNGRDQKDGLEIRESKNGDVQIPDLITVEIQNIDQALDILMVGLRNRATGSTMANSKSSRSHSIFQILLQQKIKIKNETYEDEIVIESILRIVDLAGSEKFKIPHDISIEEKQTRIDELTCINGSLSTLGHCISALIDKNRTHIPFRNSKLTRVLSDSLSGNGKITFIVCISPSMSSSSETFSTLQFANRAKRAVLDGRNLRADKIAQNKRMIDYEEYAELSKAYARERFLREEMEKSLKKNSTQYDLELENIQLKKENEELRQMISAMRNGTPISEVSNSLSRNSTIEDQSSMNNLSQQSRQLIHQQNRQSLQSGSMGSSLNAVSQQFKKMSNSSIDKKVRFVEGNRGNDKLKQEIECDDNSIFENLSIFKELKQQQNGQGNANIINNNNFNSLNSNHSENMSIRINQFWKAGEDEGSISEFADNINFNKLDHNKLLQRIKRKEIEKKLEMFFAYNSPDNQSLKLFNDLKNDEGKQLEDFNNEFNGNEMDSSTPTPDDEFVNRMINMVSAIQKKTSNTSKASSNNQKRESEDNSSSNISFIPSNANQMEYQGSKQYYQENLNNISESKFESIKNAFAMVNNKDDFMENQAQKNNGNDKANISLNGNNQMYDASLLSIKDDLETLNKMNEIKRNPNTYQNNGSSNMQIRPTSKSPIKNYNDEKRVESSSSNRSSPQKKNSNQISQQNKNQNIGQQMNQLKMQNNYRPELKKGMQELKYNSNEISLNFDTNQTSNTNKNFDSIIQKVQDKSQNITNIVHDLKQEMSKAISQLHMLQQADQEIRMADDFSDKKSLNGSSILAEKKNMSNDFSPSKMGNNNLIFKKSITPIMKNYGQKQQSDYGISKENNYD
ncbi:kinesin motor catalytic domain protein (macronuclear) [Tetrahymena thermophila SB210]|uniref:Kinesin motor catalytic domain protein n=1 Tax=Tetrahymena thermophila (strain SB210) TaxID=312017 RepID=I7MDX6_TETTS|nr:kinesin motor catalytic domain protein [Tetrahymena thermophila SB210]EAR92908.2 kinesin motor catalytic domain protein [Tetrahymena thermophila SB210]|eukprot:XP_001013153.2 kinesin motor catalytic domain protein [Tetrahymena thermophila SB210]